MTTNFLTYAVAGTLGVILQICLMKIPALKIKAKTANHSFSFKDYIKDDWPAIIASFATVGVMIICLDEVLKLKPALADYIKWLFVFVGFTGSTIIQALFSLTNKKIMQVIDVKTNIADGVVPPVTQENIQGAIEIAKEKNEADKE